MRHRKAHNRRGRARARAGPARGCRRRRTTGSPARRRRSRPPGRPRRGCRGIAEHDGRQSRRGPVEEAAGCEVRLDRRHQVDVDRLDGDGLAVDRRDPIGSVDLVGHVRRGGVGDDGTDSRDHGRCLGRDGGRPATERRVGCHGEQIGPESVDFRDELRLARGRDPEDRDEVATPMATPVADSTTRPGRPRSLNRASGHTSPARRRDGSPLVIRGARPLRSHRRAATRPGGLPGPARRCA